MVTNPIRGPLLDLSSISEISRWIKSATRTERFPSVMPPSPHPSCSRDEPSEGQNLDLRMDHLDDVHLLDKIDNLVEARIDVSPVISHRTDPDLGSLPEIVVPHFGDGHI